MKKTKGRAFDHSGSDFDSFLEEEGIREDVKVVALKRVLTWQLQEGMRQAQAQATQSREARVLTSRVS